MIKKVNEVRAETVRELRYENDELRSMLDVVSTQRKQAEECLAGVEAKCQELSAELAATQESERWLRREYEMLAAQMEVVNLIFGGLVMGGTAVDVIKKSPNAEFDVIYADGSRRHVTEGVLHEAKDNEIIFHNGTADPAVIIASAEDILKTLKRMGYGLALLSIKMHLTPESTEVLRELVWFADDLLNNSSEDKQGIFRLGQMDMKESIAAMLDDFAKELPRGVTSASLRIAADKVRAMSIPEGNANENP